MLEVRGISKSYEGEPLLRDISFDVKLDETVCLLGPSGSGKSTLARQLAEALGRMDLWELELEWLRLIEGERKGGDGNREFLVAARQT